MALEVMGSIPITHPRVNHFCPRAKVIFLYLIKRKVWENVEKLTLVINGRGGVGKDTLCEAASAVFRVLNVSSITPIKALAKQCGWQGEKSDEARRFLADLKAAAIRYNDYPTHWISERYREFLSGEDEILFVHIREPQEIEKFVKATGGEAKTLLVRANLRMPVHTYGNASDDGVENYPYDYYFDNDSEPALAAEAFIAFLQSIAE